MRRAGGRCGREEAIAAVLGQLDSLLDAVDEVARASSPEGRAVVVEFLMRVTEIYGDWADPDRG